MGRVQAVVVGNSPLIRDRLVFIEKQTYPDSGTDTFFHQLLCKTFHIREFGVSFCPWTTVILIKTVMLLPAVINNHKRRILHSFCQFQDVICIT